MIRLMFVIYLAASLVACAGDGPGRSMNTVPVREVVPRAEPLSKQGNPDSYVQSGKRYFVLPTARGYRERGIASWYGRKFHGRRTSNGEKYDMYAMTAAHTTLPLPSYVRVTNLKNGSSIIVRVNDRGPFVQNRIIDLSYAAAERLDMIRDGTALVEVVAVQPGESSATAKYQSRYQGVEDWRDESHLRDRIYIQVGAFSIRQNAEQLLQKLLAARIGNTNIQSTEEGGAVLHRVRIGPLQTVAATDQTAKLLEDLQYTSYQIIIE
ncbi:MAG: septal ring lytic transglycosylase RlpA family protein [Gammaproteobacteria bacterium]|nr:septal ring lytic transglycosylase RlpA family protein [Gammaproteobacteria bacterium]